MTRCETKDSWRVFDFERQKGRDFTETTMTLAGMSCFVIADITNPRSAPLELQATVSRLYDSLCTHSSRRRIDVFNVLEPPNEYDWVLDSLVYDSSQSLIDVLDDAVISPALGKRHELE